jgi:hypothetical protein
MKIGIMADSHEDMVMIAKSIEYFNQFGVDKVIHAGDIISPITCRYFKDLKAKLIAVYGNNDGDKLLLREKFNMIDAEIYEPPYQLELDGKRFIIYHKHDVIEGLAKCGVYDVIIYGHTHGIDIRKDKTIIINPGECCGLLTGKCTVAILDTRDMSVRIKELER